MTIGTFMDCSGIVTEIRTQENHGSTDSTQQVLRQSTTVVCRLLVAIMTGEFCILKHIKVY
jgi:hypothetical protein